jgi:hypothetical protein
MKVGNPMKQQLIFNILIDEASVTLVGDPLCFVEQDSDRSDACTSAGLSQIGGFHIISRLVTKVILP